MGLTEAFGVSRNGANFAGQEGGRPVLWLAQDGLAHRFPVDHDGVPFSGEWLVQWNVGPIHIESVNDVHATKRSFHFVLYGGPVQDSWYVQTPRDP